MLCMFASWVFMRLLSGEPECAIFYSKSDSEHTSVMMLGRLDVILKMWMRHKYILVKGTRERGNKNNLQVIGNGPGDDGMVNKDYK